MSAVRATKRDQHNGYRGGHIRGALETAEDAWRWINPRSTMPISRFVPIISSFKKAILV